MQKSKKEESDKEAERKNEDEHIANALTPISEGEEGEEENSHVYRGNGYISINIEDINPLIEELIMKNLRSAHSRVEPDGGIIITRLKEQISEVI